VSGKDVSVGRSRRAVLGLALTGGAAGALGLSRLANAGTTRRRVYLGSYTSEGGKGIGVGSIDEATGRLTIAHWDAGVTDPSWLDLAPDGHTLYAVSETGPTGRITALHLDSAGNPGVLGSRKTGAGPAHVRVHPAGKYAFTANYDGGTVGVYPIRAGGSLGAATDTVRHTPAPAHPHQTVVDPSGQWILSVDLGVDAVYVYRLDATAGKLTQHAKVRLRKAAGPRHLAFHPGGKYAYVADETDSTVTVCAWKAGTLTPGQVVSTRPKPATTVNNPGEIAVSPDGRFVYVTNRGDNTIAVFAVAKSGAALKLVASPACGGREPRHLAIDPAGRWLYVANQHTNQVAWFALDGSTGLPRKAGTVSAPAVSQVLIA
jgi:6-phosphogluconolactonase (cycloisomerase 2 family)